MSGLLDHKIAFIGFGEAASAFVKGWDVLGAGDIRAYDIKTDHKVASVRLAKAEDYARFQVQGCATLSEALCDVDIVFSLVTADQALIVAELAAKCIADGAFYFDCNSCAPGTKRKNADAINFAGGKYVDAAVMAPVYPRMHQTPIALSGRHSVAGKELLDRFDMNVSIVDGNVGASSSIKMVRSIMMKGMEALFAECVLAGRKAGVEDVVLDSLDKTYPGFDFKEKATYMLERSMTHGKRRAAEMKEVALTVDELGLSGDMARATVNWQQRIGDLEITAIDGETYKERADKILTAFQKDQK